MRAGLVAPREAIFFFVNSLYMDNQLQQKKKKNPKQKKKTEKKRRGCVYPFIGSSTDNTQGIFSTREAPEYCFLS
jgi:hypothetical protein